MCRTRAFPSRSRAFGDLCTGSRKCELSLPRLQKKQSVLMSVVAGEAVASVRTLDDKQVLQQCMAALRELFKEQVRAASGTGEKADGRVGPSPVVRLPAKSPGWPAGAAVTKYPNLGGFNDGHFRSRSSEAGRSKIKVQAGLASSQASLLGLQMTAFLTWSSRCAWLCPNCLFLEGHQSDWMKAHLRDLMGTELPCERPFLRYGDIMRFGGFRVLTHEFEGAAIESIAIFHTAFHSIVFLLLTSSAHLSFPFSFPFPFPFPSLPFFLLFLPPPPSFRANLQRVTVRWGTDRLQESACHVCSGATWSFRVPFLF